MKLCNEICSTFLQIKKQQYNQDNHESQQSTSTIGTSNNNNKASLKVVIAVESYSQIIRPRVLETVKSLLKDLDEK